MKDNGSALHASPGDRLVIRGHQVGEVARDAEILEVIGDDGRPPYVVRWEEDGHVSRLYPSSDASCSTSNTPKRQEILPHVRHLFEP